MNATTVKILLVATVVVVMLAVVVQRRSGPGGEGHPLPDRVVPTLVDRVNDVAAIEVVGGGEALELQRRESGWVVASRAGYPAKFETVKEAIVSISQLEPRERKTADPARYERLGLAEPGDASESVRVTLRDTEGKEIAGVVLGNDVSEGGASQRYVRTVSDAQAWLAEGRVNVPTDPLQWMDRDIMRIARDRITRVRIRHPDGEEVSIAREQGGTNYTLETAPEGRTPKSAAEIGAPASALAYLRFDNVRADDGLGLDMGSPTVTVFETANGLRVTARTWKVEDKTWASFAAEAVPSPAATDAGEGQEPEAGTGGAEDSETAPEAEPGATGTEPPAAEENSAAKEAEELNAKLSGWLFAIPEYQAGSLRKRLDDLTEAPTPPEEQPAPEEEEQPLFIPSLDARDDPPEDGPGED
jgi:hypothetical protein